NVVANQAPVVTYTPPSGQIVAGSTVTLSATATDDFDGAVPVQFTVNGRAIEGNTFEATTPGGYLIRAWAQDSDGLVGEVHSAISVVAPGTAPAAVTPVVTFTGVPQTHRAGMEATVTAVATLPQGAGGSITGFRWGIDGQEPDVQFVRTAGDTST